MLSHLGVMLMSDLKNQHADLSDLRSCLKLQLSSNFCLLNPSLFCQFVLKSLIVHIFCVFVVPSVDYINILRK
jgi:hypothetical protein